MCKQNNLALKGLLLCRSKEMLPIMYKIGICRVLKVYFGIFHSIEYIELINTEMKGNLRCLCHNSIYKLRYFVINEKSTITACCAKRCVCAYT